MMLSTVTPQFALRLLLIVLVFGIGTEVATAQSFKTPTAYEVSPSPNRGVAGDFNGDGRPDLATANAGSASVTIRHNAGNGTFPTAITYTTDSNANGVATADFNADGKLDLAVGNFFGGPFSQGNISILLGNGDGTFQAAVNYDAGTPAGVSVADLNGDNKQDLVAASWVSGKATVLLGNGNGTFQSAVPYTVGSEPREVAIADYNGDTKLDLALSNGASNNISILLGNGNGTFQAAVNKDLGTRVIGLVTTDLNGDNKRDLLTVAFDATALLVLLGNGDGSFQTAVPYSVGSQPHSVALGDFNGDTKTDAIVVNTVFPSSYSVLRGNGDGTFQSALTSPARNGSFFPVAADFDGDGKPDLAIVNNAQSLIDIFLNSPKATGLNIAATETVSATFQVATFITYDNTKTAASFTATINWGDGTAPSAGTISANGSGGFNVSGTHTFADDGNFNVTVQIADDSGNFASASSTAVVASLKADSAVALTSSVNPSELGQSVTFTATVTSDAGTPIGSVQFKSDGNNLGTPVVLNGSGVATFTTSALTAGTHTITAEYPGTAVIDSSIGTLAGGQVVRPVPTLSVNDVSITEGNSGTKTVNFIVTLSSVSNFTVTVDYATANSTATAGSDYQATSGTLIFSPGDTTKNLAINVNGDLTNEFDEIFFFNLTNASNATISDAQGTGTIVNDDAPVLLIDPNTGRAVALDSVTMTTDPFSLLNLHNLNDQDHRRRVSLFVWRLGLLPGDTIANVSVTADDGSGGVYVLPVEFIGPLTGVADVTQIVVRLPDNVTGAPRDLTVKVLLRGPASNGAIIKIAGP